MSRSEWRKSSACAGNGDCLQVRFYGDGYVTLRDSARPDAEVHAVSPQAWAAFIAGVRNGEFDGPADREATP